MNQPLNKNKAYLLDIIKCCQSCESFIGKMTLAEFIKDEKTISAVQHQILIIGEATKRLSVDFKNSNTNIPWKAMAGMRDVLIHSYENADYEEIWKTVHDVMPELLAKLKKISI